MATPYSRCVWLLLLYALAAAPSPALSARLQKKSKKAVETMMQSIDLRESDEVDAGNDEGAGTTSCPCWAANKWGKASECCRRTDHGSVNHERLGESITCAPLLGPTPAMPDMDCRVFCSMRINCKGVPHPNDTPSTLEYWGEKLQEIGKMGKADLLLAKASTRAASRGKPQKGETIKVAGIHTLHPVGTWRPKTWEKTLARKDALIAGKQRIISQGTGLLKSADVNMITEFAPLCSVSPFIAVPFPFCGIKHVTIEGNGRIKGMRLAVQEDSDLSDLSVEVDLMKYPGSKVLPSLQEAILKLWAQYTEEGMEAAREAQEAMDKEAWGENVTDATMTELKSKSAEYLSFRVGVVKCVGLSQFNGCIVVDFVGAVPTTAKNGFFSIIPAGSLVGVSRIHAHGSNRVRQFAKKFLPKQKFPQHLEYFELCDQPGKYMIGDDGDGSVVKKYCPSCIDVGDVVGDGFG